MMAKSQTQKKPHTLTLTARASFFWGLCLFFLLAWIFVLGILVGRGFIPDGVKSISELKAQIARLQGMLLHNKAPEPEPAKTNFEDPKLAFYEDLSIKKKEVARRGQSMEETRKEGEPKAVSHEKKMVQPPSQKKTPSTSAYRFTIQLASLESSDKAKALTKRVSDKGFQAYYYEVRVKGKSRYRVRSGRFVTSGEAEQYAKEIFNALKIKGFTVKIDKGK
jgi:SPOR domain